MEQLTAERMYQALVAKESQFEGVFYAAIKTTGIFCRPTCKAKKPKAENVLYFKTTKEALAHGFRACKMCKPLNNPGQAPEFVSRLIEKVQHEPSKKISDQALRGMDIEPNKVRRWFKENHGLTFQAYQRMNRINGAYQKLKDGEKVTNIAFDSGYESLSGFSEAFRNLFGHSPAKNSKRVITLQRIESPLGPMYAAATDKGLCLLEFTDRRMLEREFQDLCKRLNARILFGKNKHISNLITQLEEYFSKRRQVFDLSMERPGTEFQQTVWTELTTIPYGKTRSYIAQATALNKPKAVRAVASANGMNRIAIVVPCHRVIGSNGELTGYAGGLWRKKWLLDFESDQQKLNF